MNKIRLYFHTIRYLKIKQVYYRLYYYFVDKFSRGNLKLSQSLGKHGNFLKYHLPYKNKTSFEAERFTFLNISHTFKDDLIDWELMKYGKLWQYNLCYFDYLNQPNMSQEEGVLLIKKFINYQENLKSAIEPYPTSLRVINWIKFVSSHQINDQEIIDAIYVQANHVYHRVEYHLLGNHLLENAFCLLHAGFFFEEEKFLKVSKRLLKQQLEEQILTDGGHFELSPTYHQIILFRVLEGIDLFRNNKFLNDDYIFTTKELKSINSFNESISLFSFDSFVVKKILEEKASKMLAWLENITFNNGDIPLLNDASFDIAPTTFELLNLSSILNIQSISIPLSTSGYRKYGDENFEMVFDVGKIGPNYQPGHAHADTFNIVIYLNNKPFIVDTGTSTYEKNDRRQTERSTQSHNTVTFHNENQSQVWGGFRVAERAEVQILQETEHSITASHYGYRKFGVTHQRQVQLRNGIIIIQDEMVGTSEVSVAHFHFHPTVSVELIDNIIYTDDCHIIFTNFEKISIEDYLFAPRFNQVVSSKKILIEFRKTLTTQIK